MGKQEYAVSILFTIMSLIASINVGSPATFSIFLALLIFNLLAVLYPLLLRNQVDIANFQFEKPNMYRNQYNTLKLSIVNNSIIPIFVLKIKINSGLLESNIDNIVVYLPGKSKTNFEIPVKAIKRGYLEKIEIQLYLDLFFNIFKPISKLLETSLYIYPNFAHINMNNLYSINTQQNISFIYKLEEEGDFFSIRDYQMEDIKKISWKHWAKSGKLVVKQKAKYSLPQINIIINNISIDENTDEDFIEKINTFLRYLISNNLEIYLSTIEKINFIKITDLKSSLVFLANTNFIDIYNESNLKNINKNTIIISNSQKPLKTNLPQLVL